MPQNFTYQHLPLQYVCNEATSSGRAYALQELNWIITYECPIHKLIDRLSTSMNQSYQSPLMNPPLASMEHLENVSLPQGYQYRKKIIL